MRAETCPKYLAESKGSEKDLAHLFDLRVSKGRGADLVRELFDGVTR
jgi:hypothetical protein